MTSLLSARRRAEEFASAIDPSGTREDAAPSADLEELVELVAALRSEELPRPRPEFTASLRERLVAEAEATLAEDVTLTLHPRRRGTRERRLALVASSLVLVGGSAGMAVAAQDALPGDALYPIKRGLERAEADLSRSEVGKGRDLLQQARSRLSEVRGIVGTSAENQVPGTVEDFSAQASAGADLVLDSFQDSQDRQLVLDLRTFTAESLAVLQSVAATAAPEHQDELAAAAGVLLEIDQRAASACATCADGNPALQLPAPFLAANEANRALDASRRAKLVNNHPLLPETGDRGDRQGQGSTGDQESSSQQGEEQGSEGEGSGKGLDLPLPDTGSTAGQDGQGGQGGDKGGKRDRGLLGTVNDTGKELLPEELDPLLDTLLP